MIDRSAEDKRRERRIFYDAFDGYLRERRDGKLVFHPRGHGRQGYLVESKEQLEKLRRRWRSSFYGSTIAFAIIASYLAGLPGLVIGLGLGFGAHRWWASRAGRELEPSDEALTREEERELALQRMGPISILALFAFAFAGVWIGVRAAEHGELKDWVLAALCIGLVFAAISNYFRKRSFDRSRSIAKD